jgi:Lsr2
MRSQGVRAARVHPCTRLDGTDYEIDLSGKHSGKLHDALRKYIDHARKVGGTPRRRSAGIARAVSGRPGAPGEARREPHARHERTQPMTMLPRRTADISLVALVG